MLKTVRTMGFVAVMGALAIPGFAWAQERDRVVATVNGTEITLGHMLMARASLPPEYQQLPDNVLWDGILTQLVQQEVLAQSKGAAETPRVTIALQNEKRSLLAAEAISKVAENAATPAAIDAAYKRDYLEGEKSREFNASHILLETEEAAQAVLDELREGADFADTARTKSTGPSGPNGGSLGWFGPGMMVAPFQEAVEAMQPGEVAGPVQTQFGYHVIKLNEVRTQEAPDLEAVRAEIETSLQQAAVEEEIARLTTEATVTQVAAGEVDPALLSQIDLLED